MSNPLQTILDNPLIKTLALGKLKKALVTEGIKTVIINVSPDGELTFDSHKVETVTIPADDYNKLLKLATQ